MADNRGIFTLSEIFSQEEWSGSSDVYINDLAQDTGYFGGGVFGASNYSTFDKVSYSSDTTAAVPGTGLSVARYSLAATSNSLAGYFGGGHTSTSFTTMDKVTYSSNTTSAVPAAFLSIGRRELSATGNLISGYFSGGQISPNAYSTTDKVTYSSDTIAAVPTAFLGLARYYLASTGNSIAGYFGGGTTDNTTARSTVDKISYATDTRTTVPGSNLTAARFQLAATGNSNFGYFGAGTSSGSSFFSTVDKITYSTETTSAVPGSNLITTIRQHAATGSSGKGYFGGGTAAPGATTSVQRVDYSLETTAAVPGAFLSIARVNLAATSARANALPPVLLTSSRRFSDNASSFDTGYFGGGFPGPLSSMDKITYSTDSTGIVPGLNLSSARSTFAATGNLNFGYFGGGGNVSTTEKVNYSSDTIAVVPGAALFTSRLAHAATGNQNAGYFGGGIVPSVPTYTAQMDKITYSTDTRATIPSAALSIAGRTYLMATGNQNAGYFSGGTVPGGPSYTIVDKVTYSTDTTTAVPSAFLSVVLASSATGNSSEGYFCVPNTGAEKISYSTDTRSNPTTVRFANTISGATASATGNSISGYFAGGANPAIPGFYSRVEKLSYSTELVTRVSGSALSAVRSYFAASSSKANGLPQQEQTPTLQQIQGDTGYFGGGQPGPTSTMDKVTYSTDTTAVVPGAALSAARYGAAATGSSTAGYFGGGTSPAANLTTMDKVTYASDTTAAVPGAGLSVARNNLAATGNSIAGYYGGGGPTERSTMDKVTYASDTTAAVPGAALSVARRSFAATGNSTAGYFGGGFAAAGVTSTMDKVTYSTDTRTTVPSAALSFDRLSLAATGNTTGSSAAGYFGGGGPGFFTTMDKVTYSTDTRTTVPSAALIVARNGLAATGNSTGSSAAGYFGGGAAPGIVSTMDKVTYSTDTTATVPSASLSVARNNLSASSSVANAVRGTQGQSSVL